MPTLDTIVDVTIDRQTQAVQATGFGLPMFLGLGKGFTTRTKLYNSISAVAEDFSTSSAEYKAATAYFSQAISVQNILIGRRNSTVATLTPVVANNTLYSVTIDGTLFTFTSDADATADEIVAGLVAAINGGNPAVAASGVSTLILTPDDVEVPFELQYSDNLSVIYTAVESLSAALAAIAIENNDWYGLSCYSHTKADILEVAAYAEAAKKLYFYSSADSDILTDVGSDTTSIAYAMKAASYGRSVGMYSAVAANYPEAAYASVILARTPGSQNPAFRTLNGVTVDALTVSQETAVLAKNMSTYTTTAGVNYIFEGLAADGTYLDVVRDTDYLEARLQEDVFGVLVRNSKIPYTDAGIAIIEATVRGRLARAVDENIIAPGFIVTVPRAVDVSQNDKANRILPDVKFQATLANCINRVVINGVISL